jgi:hypothetical protein
MEAIPMRDKNKPWRKFEKIQQSPSSLRYTFPQLTNVDRYVKAYQNVSARYAKPDQPTEGETKNDTSVIANGEVVGQQVSGEVYSEDGGLYLSPDQGQPD